MPQPNIIFILLDDLGWRDLTCYGSTFYETPNLDRLATAGMQFTNAYAACPVCSPTRASLLTGKYPATLGLTDWIDWGIACHPRKGRLVDVPYIKQMPLSEHCLARALQKGGYATWHVGKWHLGTKGFYPTDHGFDVNIGGCEWGAPTNGYWSPWHLPTLPDAAPGTYLTDHLTDKAIELIRQHASSVKPFFLNLWHHAVHTPIQAPPALVKKYEAKAQRLGLDKQQALETGEPMPYVNSDNRHIIRRLIQSDPVYAAMIENLDTNIGRLLAVVPENTIVIFTSDNGGLATAEGSPTTNRPLAEGKGWMYEGGTREPFLVKWPGVTQPGAISAVPITSPDLYPTILEMAGFPPLPQQHVDGTSFAPVLRGATQHSRAPLFWHYPHYGNQGGTPGSSIRQGDWKLIEFFEDGRLELFNLRDDIGEEHNLAATQPVVTRRLHEQLVAWRNSIEAKIPQCNPDWKE